MSDLVSSAVVSEMVSRATCFVAGKCSEQKGIDERIHRLEMLLIKIKSAVEVSEAFDITIKPLHEWQEKLKEALCEADETLRSFMKNTSLPEKPIQKTIEGGGSSSHDYQSMQGEGYDDGETLVHGHTVTCQVDMEAKLHLATTLKNLFFRVLQLVHHTTDSPWPAILQRLSAFARVLDPRTFNLLNPRMMVDKYLENDEKVSKLIKTVEKLEKTAGDIGDFIELLKLQSKRQMNRKRKRSARPNLPGCINLVIPLELSTHALLCYGRTYDHLLVIKLFTVLILVPCDFNLIIFTDCLASLSSFVHV